MAGRTAGHRVAHGLPLPDRRPSVGRGVPAAGHKEGAEPRQAVATASRPMQPQIAAGPTRRDLKSTARAASVSPA